MTINELLTLMDREAETLTAENYHAAASIMRAAAARLRCLARHVDEIGTEALAAWTEKAPLPAGVNDTPEVRERARAWVERCSHGVRSNCTAYEPLARLRRH